jgi:hypothetical protein
MFQNKGVLTVAMLDEILNLPEYPRGKRLFIVDMMKKFELCYDIEAGNLSCQRWRSPSQGQRSRVA